MAGPFEARALWRERVGTQTHEFVFTRDEAELFFKWWREDLMYGGAWFVARWPHPAGWVRIERQFTSAPKQSYVDGGVRRISIESQFRGFSLD